MNQTQKKYTINRINTLIGQKMRGLETESLKQRDLVERVGKVTLLEALDYIASGQASFMDIDQSTKTAGMSLSGIYDLTELEDAAKARVDAMEENIAGNYGNYFTFDGNNYRYHFQSIHDRMQALVKAQQDSSDAVMLGSDEEALAAIQAIQDLVV